MKELVNLSYPEQILNRVYYITSKIGASTVAIMLIIKKFSYFLKDYVQWIFQIAEL